MKCLAIIPARMAATRFPGKPMHPLCGMPMIEHIYHRVCMAEEFSEVFVATCDQVIFDHIESIGGKAVMTANTHERCTERTAEALEKIEHMTGESFDIVVMVQGDEPFVYPGVFGPAIAKFSETDVQVVNLMSPIKTEQEFNNPNYVKVVTDLQGDALYYSREPIPSMKKGERGTWNRQTGLIMFRRDFLFQYLALEPTPLEKVESVDMLRILEHGQKVRMFLAEFSNLCVDCPEDVASVEAELKGDKLFAKYKK